MIIKRLCKARKPIGISGPLCCSEGIQLCIQCFALGVGEVCEGGAVQLHQREVPQGQGNGLPLGKDCGNELLCGRVLQKLC